jgi:ubiquinone/menaquinone biosynthesis C-methylase UbiE
VGQRGCLRTLRGSLEPPRDSRVRGVAGGAARRALARRRMRHRGPYSCCSCARTPSEVLGIDPSAAYVASARAQMDDSRARFDLGDAQALQAPAATFDVVVSGLVLNFVAQSDRAVAEMARVARPGEPLQPTFGTTPKACG